MQLSEDTHETASDTGTGTASTPMAVLLVDDDRELCRMLAEYLQPEGFRSRRCTTAMRRCTRLGGIISI